jgi:hypothetical protein
MGIEMSEFKKIGHGDDLKWASDGSVQHCVQCGKKIGKSAKWVQVFGGGAVFAKSEGECERDGGWMGWFPVGSECAKSFASGVLYEALENDNHDAEHKKGAGA